MKISSYTDRDRKTLLRAMTWALKKLYLQNWTVQLKLDNEVDEDAELGKMLNTAGCNAYVPTLLDATIGIRRGICQQRDYDAVDPLFHEILHIAFWFSERPNGSHADQDLWEQSLNRMTAVLYELWKVTEAPPETSA